eukprot:scaffold2094_cov239-Pinguiococcus_pyrenoidosus.AAC.12
MGAELAIQSANAGADGKTCKVKWSGQGVQQNSNSYLFVTLRILLMSDEELDEYVGDPTRTAESPVGSRNELAVLHFIASTFVDLALTSSSKFKGHGDLLKIQLLTRPPQEVATIALGEQTIFSKLVSDVHRYAVELMLSQEARGQAYAEETVRGIGSLIDRATLALNGLA